MARVRMRHAHNYSARSLYSAHPSLHRRCQTTCLLIPCRLTGATARACEKVRPTNVLGARRDPILALGTVEKVSTFDWVVTLGCHGRSKAQPS